MAVDWSFLWENLEPEFQYRLRELQKRIDSNIAGGTQKNPIDLIKKFLQIYEKQEEELVAKLLDLQEEMKFLQAVLKMID